jgi:tetratricopeptide (TPR) repeat protein
MEATQSHATQESPAGLSAADCANRLSDGQANTIYRAAYQLSESGRHDQAVALFALLGLYRPQEPKYALAAAICFRRTGRYDQAIAFFAQTMKLRPHEYGPAFQMVECMMLQGRRDESVQLLKDIAAAATEVGEKNAAERAGALLELVEQSEKKWATQTSR